MPLLAPGAASGATQGGRGGAGDAGAIGVACGAGNRSEFDEPRPVAVLGGQAPRHLDRQPGLAGPAHADDRYKSAVL
jgi:hypothetical protein